MRSQLDCHDARLPGSGVFDIKTRACMPIRIDLFNFEENSGYLIRSQHGKYESFEREYFDLVRSAFLKYQYVNYLDSIQWSIDALCSKIPGSNRRYGWGDCGVPQHKADFWVSVYLFRRDGRKVIGRWTRDWG